MGVDAGDFDHDGSLDLFVTTFSEDTKTLYRNRGDGTFEDISWRSGIGPASWLFLGWGTKFFDYDNDGQLDLIATNGHVYPEADRFSGGSTYRQRQLLFHSLGNRCRSLSGICCVSGSVRGSRQLVRVESCSVGARVSASRRTVTPLKC